MRKINAAILAISAVFCMVGAPANAETDYSPDRILKSVELDDLKAVVASFNHKVIMAEADGEPSITAKSDSGLIYSLSGSACKEGERQTCKGVIMQVRYGMPDQASYRTVATANMKHAAISSWIDMKSETIGFTRYVVLNNGVTMANLRENVNVLMALTPSALKWVLGKKE